MTKAVPAVHKAALAVAAAALLQGCTDESTAPGDDPPPADAGPLKCAVGERLEDGACIAPGIPANRCAEGFESDGRSSCTPVLPPDPCPPGTMAIPGETRCREPMPCPEAEYGEAPEEASTMHVRADYSGPSDGSAAKPYTTIQDAVDAADDGAVVAIAAGTYAESVEVLANNVRLWGRCPAMTVIVGDSDPGVLVTASDASEIHDLSITGDYIGIGVAGGADLLVDRVWIHDTPLHGIAANDAFGAPRLTLRRSLVEQTGQFGVGQRGAEVTIEESVVRDSDKILGADAGAGISLLPTPNDVPQRLTVRRSVVERSYNVGIFVAGAEALVEGTVVRNTKPDAVDEITGQGIFVAADPEKGTRARVTVSGSVLHDNRSVGVHVYGSDLIMDTTVVRATLPREATAELGHGVALEFQDDASTATVTSSVLEANHYAGMLVSGSDLTMSGTVIRDTLPQASDLTGAGGLIVQVVLAQQRRASASITDSAIERNHPGGLLVIGADATVANTAIRDSDAQQSDKNFGRGISAHYEDTTLALAKLTVLGCLIEGNHDAGILFAGGEALIEDTEIRRTLARSADQRYGDGLTVFLPPEQLPTKVTVNRCRFADNTRAGVSNFGAEIVMGQSSFECNPIDIDGEPAQGQDFDFEEVGPNECRCDGESFACIVQSSNIEPPEL